jgi:predicted aspartyl protease
MRRKIIGLVVFLFCFGSASFLHADNFPANKHLKALLDSGNYFQFRIEFEAIVANYGDYISQEIWSNENLYFFAWDNFLFNDSKLSNMRIDVLLSDSTRFNPSDSVRAELLQLHFQNDIRLFDYKKADSICSVLLFRYASVIDPAVLAGIRNTGQITKALVNTPPQTLERNGDLDIKYKRDIANLIRIPVTINEVTENFMFDTGANFSTISESQAKKMGVNILHADFAITSSSRSKVDSKLGVADKMEIGNMIFRNVVFLVLPDKSLKFAGGLYKIRGIVGLPVIEAMKQIEITKDLHLRSTTNYTGNHIGNLGLEGNTPFVNVNFFGQEHTYVFDTGAAGSVLGRKFYTAYKDSLSNAEEGSSHVGGAGGVQKIQTRTAKNVHYTFGTKSGVLKTISIQLNGVTDAIGPHYGIVGEDIFMQWETMTINFDQLFVELK